MGKGGAEEERAAATDPRDTRGRVSDAPDESLAQTVPGSLARGHR